MTSGAARRPVPGILHLFHFVPPYAATVMEHAGAFSRYSGFPVFEVNTADGFPAGLRNLDFEVVLLHYSLFGSSNYFLDDRFLDFLNGTSAYKVAFFQDEYYFCRQRFAFLNRFDVDCVFTLLEPEHVATVYGTRTRVRRFESTLPGLVSDTTLAHARRFARPSAERRIDIGYRARHLPFYMGRGAQEKHEIGTLTLEHAAGSGLVLDIDTVESSRLYGDAWYRFLGDCRAVLGVEAGVSIFDLDDVVREGCTALLAAEPGLSFEEVSRRILKPWEGNVPYRTISPRHFEAAAFGCCQILYEGRYSGILEPMHHYLPLRKDWSNFDEIIALYRDEHVRAETVERAHAELIESGRYGYRAFIERFDSVLRADGISPAARGPWERDVSAKIKRGVPVRGAIRALRRRVGRLVRR